MFIVFGDFTDGFVDAGKFGVCDNSTEHYEEDVCTLTMMTMPNGWFQRYLPKRHFRGQTLKPSNRDIVGNEPN